MILLSHFGCVRNIRNITFRKYFKRSIMSNLKLVLIDLSGTLHIDNEITFGAVSALNRLRESDLKVKFVTNTTKESRRVLHERLVKLGFDLSIEEIYTSLWAARELVKNEQLNPMLILDKNALEDFSDVSSVDGKHDAVVVGLAPNNYDRPTLNKAFRILIGGGRLIAVNKSRYYMKNDGLALAAGAIVTSLEYASGKKATVVGKPNIDFFQGALQEVRPEDAIMIGDDINDDIGGAQALGIRGYLVKTGKFRAGDEDKINPAPFKCVDSFSSAVEHILSSLK